MITMMVLFPTASLGKKLILIANGCSTPPKRAMKLSCGASTKWSSQEGDLHHFNDLKLWQRCWCTIPWSPTNEVRDVHIKCKQTAQETYQVSCAVIYEENLIILWLQEQLKTLYIHMMYTASQSASAPTEWLHAGKWFEGRKLRDHLTWEIVTAWLHATNPCCVPHQL